MSETLLPDLLTPVSVGDFYDALRSAWTDGAPSRDSLRVIVAQSALETGWWKSAHRFNFGNVKHVPGDGHDYCQFRCNEIVGGKVVWYDPPHPATSFVAFQSIDDGMSFYVNILRTRFKPAWPAVLSGDPVAFCSELSLAHYFTDDLAHYTAGVVAVFRQLDHMLPWDIAPEDVEPHV